MTDMVMIKGQDGAYDNRSQFTSPVKSPGRVSMSYNRFGGFSAHLGGPMDGEKDDDKPSTTRLIEKFTTMYQEIESRLERGISFAKEATLESKLRASSNSALVATGAIGSNNDMTCEVLDLKAELTSMKNKLFQADQKRIEEVA